MSDRDREFRAFFVAESERLRRLAIFLTGEPERAADLAQETLVRTYRHWGRIQGDSPGPYARRILVNLVRSQHRRRLLERRHLESAAPPADAVPAQAERVADWLRISGALATLPPVRRAVVVLRFYEDLTEPEIARILDRPLGTVKSDLHRALAKLRPLLADLVGAEPPGETP